MLIHDLPNNITYKGIDWIIGRCLKIQPMICKYDFGDVDVLYKNVDNVVIVWSPSTIWEQGGPLVEKYKISLIYNSELELWSAQLYELKYTVEAKTMLKAAMRLLAHELVKKHNNVYVPDELFIQPLC